MSPRFLCPLALVLVALLVPLRADTGVAGQWRVEFATPLGQRGVNMTIEQDGAKLSGHVSDPYGEYALKGRFVQGRVTASWTVPEDGKMLEITMRGRLHGNTISGTAQLGDVGEGPLSAHRTGGN